MGEMELQWDIPFCQPTLTLPWVESLYRGVEKKQKKTQRHRSCEKLLIPSRIERIGTGVVWIAGWLCVIPSTALQLDRMPSWWTTGDDWSLSMGFGTGQDWWGCNDVHRFNQQT
jgi:hypothetical protein